MKKLIILFIIGTTLTCTAFGDDYICPNTYVLNSGFTKFLSNASGSNLLYTKALEHVLEKQAKKEFKGNFDVQLKSFSKKDLREGKFKSLNAIGENIEIDGISLNKVSLNSLCEFNQFSKNENGKYEFVTDFPANIKFELTPDNINQISNLPEFKNKINDINIKLKGFLQINGIKFDIKDEKLIYYIDYIIPFSPKEQTISIKTDVMYFNNSVYNQSETADNKSAILNFLKLSDTLNYINPLDFSAKFLQNNNIVTKLKNIYIRDGKVIVEALLNITK